ncbi:MAG: glycosyltransferase [Spirulinaceae cyanobacterium RM2_2_10]|nr:glycosyltransferase [Spirulinaceae cyanobacterium SM2_1_0]NJO19114.1 glycosyltransferase [Spirulinaceae cyanobacterium RM2_2_10]
MNPVDCLIIFSRYPEAGHTKTRLIPALGAEGAAQVQQQMTEHILARALQLQAQQPLAIELHFAGGSLTEMQAWLGTAINLHPQSEGDLGIRLTTAFANAFQRGFRRVVTIGIDCPAIDRDLLQQAFAALESAELVLGPALDGGYYLIGLQQPVPELFQDIAWGTGQVLKQTLAHAQRSKLIVTQLDPLADVDRPEDLPIWYQSQATNETNLAL